MEYLVTMTTHVPDGTEDAAVDDMRAREAAHSRDLAAEGHLLRLWRPPLEPGEWRSLGMFDAADRAELEEVLVSMPLRVWRSDEVLPLAPHPNDPGPPSATRKSLARGSEGSEFLTTFTETVPPGTPKDRVDDTTAREADRARALAEGGQLLRLWTLPGENQALGLWRANDADEMQAILASLPLNAFMSVETIKLTPHPSDPALAQN